jgi:SAM-dependent methyltransferase
MKRITRPMFRYGEADFDAGYLQWGFHDRETQVREAESVLAILKPASPLRILDLACGIGAHAIHWATRGHAVTGVDLSETFVGRARLAAAKAGVPAELLVADVRELGYDGQFDLVTWVECSFFNEEMAHKVHRALRPGGIFLTDARNPDHPRTRARSGNWRTWREEDGIFYLERHETDPETGRHEDAWITIDPQRKVIEERLSVDEQPAAKRPEGMARLLREAGFVEVTLRTMAGEPFEGGEEPHWLWLVGRKASPEAESSS